MHPQPVPAGWPQHVRPPGTPDFARTAATWLLDHCPPDYRAHPVLHRNPQLLAWLALRHVHAQQSANTTARGATRAELHPVLDVRTVEAVLTVLDAEQARLIGVERAVRLITAALNTSATP